MREFMSPSGRHWVVGVFYFPNTGTGLVGETPPLSSGSVLRFRSGDITLDLADWPNEWHRMDDAGLVALLRRATTPDFSART